MKTNHRIRILCLTAITVIVPSCIVAEVSAGLSDDAARLETGKQVYLAKCAVCHGQSGEGTADVKQPLFGDRATADLAEVIHRTMPEGSPEECVGDEARMVAEWMQQAFYSPEAQARLNPPRQLLSRLTVSQYRNAVADLSTSFRWNARPDEHRGLKAEYYASRNTRRDRRVIERIDPVVDFNFGKLSPDGEKIQEDEFSARWTGSIIIEETGWYEFVLNSENGARLFVNDSRNPLIDVWVRSGPETEFRASRYLLAGRLYPITIEWFKFKENTASVALRWKRPQGVTETIPSASLTTASSPEIIVVETPFPPDDRSSGFERGTSVSQEWVDATTYAALETAEKVIQQLPGMVQGFERGRRGRREGEAALSPEEQREKLKEFAYQFVERAFRRPLTDEQKSLYVDRHFEETKSEDDAIRRVVLLTLKSPMFLYRESPSDRDQFATASRLSFALMNSIPDKDLFAAAQNGQLEAEDQIRQQAWRLVNDPRSHSRLHEFLRGWLALDRIQDLDKSEDLYPDFTVELAADLRQSLDLTLAEFSRSKEPRLTDLLLKQEMFVNSRIAEFYGVKLPSDAATSSSASEHPTVFREVTFEPEHRSGILTHPYLLSGFAYHSTSSPIHRGVFVSRGILGRALKAPPVAVAPTAPELAPELTTRERVVLQTSPDQCARCHTMINSLGFPLENFDAVGRYRTEEKGRPIDSTGVYLTRTGVEQRFGGVRDLANYLAQSDETYRSFVRQLFHHQIQQPILAFGPEAMTELSRYFQEQDGRVRNLMVEIAVRSALWKDSNLNNSNVADSSESRQ